MSLTEAAPSTCSQAAPSRLQLHKLARCGAREVRHRSRLSGEPIQFRRGLVEDASPKIVRQARKRVYWGVEIPMRVVGSKHQGSLGAVPLEHLKQMRGVFGFFQRLRGESHVFPDVLAGGLAYPWRLVAQSLPVGIQPPQEGCEPCVSTLNKDNLEL